MEIVIKLLFLVLLIFMVIKLFQEFKMMKVALDDRKASNSKQVINNVTNMSEDDKKEFEKLAAVLKKEINFNDTDSNAD